MAITKDFIANQFKAARTFMSGANVTIRHANKEYTGTRTSLEGDETVSGMGAIQGATGAVRLVVSELRRDHPKAGDPIQVKDDLEWQTRLIIGARYDQTRATLRIDYGERYG